MKALFDMTVWDASRYRVSPHGRKEEQAMNYWCYWMLLSLNCVYFRASTHAMTWIWNFARVRTDDRERNFRDSPVPQPVVQKFYDGPDPKTGSFEINRVTPGGPDDPAVKKRKTLKE